MDMTGGGVEWVSWFVLRSPGLETCGIVCFLQDCISYQQRGRWYIFGGVIRVLNDKDEDIEDSRDEERNERVQINGGDEWVGIILVQLFKRIYDETRAEQKKVQSCMPVYAHTKDAHLECRLH